MYWIKQKRYSGSWNNEKYCSGSKYCSSFVKLWFIFFYTVKKKKKKSVNNFEIAFRFVEFSIKHIGPIIRNTFSISNSIGYSKLSIIIFRCRLPLLTTLLSQISSILIGCDLFHHLFSLSVVIFLVISLIFHNSRLYKTCLFCLDFVFFDVICLYTR